MQMPIPSSPGDASSRFFGTYQNPVPDHLPAGHVTSPGTSPGIAPSLSGPTSIERCAYLAAIIESSDDGIISKSLDGTIIGWNSAATRLFGYQPDEIIGRPVLTLIPPELAHEEEQILKKLRAGERIEHYETTRRRKDGELIEVSITISPIRDEAGTVIGGAKIARDISDRKRVERLLLQSEKLAATGRMAAAMAHEINNPLESLINLIYLARQNSEPNGKVNALLATAEEELDRLAHIACQTLGYYKDTGAPVDVFFRDLLENVLTMYHARIGSSGIVIDRRFNDLQKIRVSKGEMLQVFSNVIANSIDAMRRGGVLIISTHDVFNASGEAIQIRIQDNGCGIEQTNIAKVFEPFFTTKGSLGTGIGLWVAKELVEQRGGLITIASSTSPESSGTTVTVEVPFALACSAPCQGNAGKPD